MKNYLKVAIVICFAILISAFIPYTQTYQTNINASFLDVVNEINHPNNWKNWYIPFKKSFEHDSTKYKITRNIIENKFSISNDGKITEVNLFGPTLLVINFSNDAYTTVVLKVRLSKSDTSTLIQKTKTTLLNYCWLSLTNKKYNYYFAQNFKNYFETPLLYYGFKIVKTGVVDTDFVTTNKATSKQNTYTTADSLQKVLIMYAKKNDLKYRDFPFLIINKKSADSVIVTNMLIITDKKVKYNTEVNYLPMPKQGNMLIGYFKGEYRKRGLLYNSMDKYIARNGLTRVVNTFEKFLDYKLPKNDSSKVDLALYYPIY